jgi:hypothetical protein
VRNACKILIGKLQGKISLGRLRDMSEDNIKMDVGEAICENVNWIQLVQNRIHWQDFVKTSMKLYVSYKQEIS